MTDQNQSAITPVELIHAVDPERVIALRAAWDMSALKERLDNILYLRNNVMIKGIHYGPPYKDSKKDVLLKPGAELLLAFFALRPEYVERSIKEIWDPQQPLFFYRYECQLYDILTGLKIGSGIGSCNSMEAKYRWRQGGRTCPNCGQASIRKSKFADRNTGDIGFYCNEKDGGCGANFASTDKRITDQQLGRIPNDDVYSSVNTIDKQSQKRAMLASTLVTTGASYLFTQDVEEFKGYEYFGDPDAIDAGSSDIPSWILAPEVMLSFGEFLSANNLKIDDLRQRTGVNILAYPGVDAAKEAVIAALKKSSLPAGSAKQEPGSKPSSDKVHWLNHQAADADAWLSAHHLHRPDVKRMTGKAINEYGSLEALQKDVEVALHQSPQPDQLKSTPVTNKPSSSQPPKRTDKGASADDTWSDERKLNAGRWVRDNFDMSSDEMLKLLGKSEWTDFAKPSEVAPAVLALASQRQVAVVARALVYTLQGRGEKAKKVCVLKTVIGDFVVFGGREGLTTKLGKPAGPQFAEAHELDNWEPDGKVTHDIAKLPIKVVWAWKQDARDITRLALVQPDEVDFSSDAPPPDETPASVPEGDAAFAQI